MRVQVARPAEHAGIAELPLDQRLEDWTCPTCTACSVSTATSCELVELGGRRRYVVKELPDDLAEREYRLLRELADDGLPTAEVVAVVTATPDGADGLLITRHIDYSLPYRMLLAGRGLHDPLPRRPPARRARRAARPAPSRRLLLGRLLAVEHAVPPRRGRVAGVRHRRRDRRAHHPSSPPASASST